ncbi:hypothetical protein YC2023_071523 [Brassica napus]
MSNKLLSEVTLDKPARMTLYCGNEDSLATKIKTRDRRSEQAWNKKTRELRDRTTTTNRLQPPPPHGNGEEEGERREITERDKRETSQGRQRARRLGVLVPGNSLHSFASVSE